MEEEASAAELISPRISFSHDLPAFAACPGATTARPEPSRSDTSFFALPRRRRHRVPAEPEFDFANAAADDVAPADRLFADGKLLPVPPLPPTTPHAHRVKQQQPLQDAAWQKATPRPRSWASPFARSSSVNSAAASSGRFTCPAFPLMRSQSAGAHRPHCKKVAPAATTAASTAAGVHSSGAGGGGAKSAYYYGYGGGRSGRSSGRVRVSPVLNVTSIGTSVVNMLSFLLCDCGEMKGARSRGFGVNCWVTR